MKSLTLPFEISVTKSRHSASPDSRNSRFETPGNFVSPVPGGNLAKESPDSRPLACEERSDRFKREKKRRPNQAVLVKAPISCSAKQSTLAFLLRRFEDDADAARLVRGKSRLPRFLRPSRNHNKQRCAAVRVVDARGPEQREATFVNFPSIRRLCRLAISRLPEAPRRPTSIARYETEDFARDEAIFALRREAEIKRTRCSRSTFSSDASRRQLFTADLPRAKRKRAERRARRTERLLLLRRPTPERFARAETPLARAARASIRLFYTPLSALYALDSRL